jgi:hypothetical protein
MGAAEQLLLCGHAGTTQASPVDVREVGGDTSRLVTIFGRHPAGSPLKWTVMCADPSACAQLSALINESLDLKF